MNPLIDNLLRSEYFSQDKKHLKWVYNRLIEVHKENPNSDYMIKFKKIIENL